MSNRFDQTLSAHRLHLGRTQPRVLQINVGKLCNLTCNHCHVDAGPGRREIMTRETMDRILAWLAPTDIPIVDITGGAPEMIPDFRHLVEGLVRQEPSRHIIDRCNLTILVEETYDWLGPFLASHRVEIIASMPCYLPENVDAQRGEGVFDDSIRALRLLNGLGYGRDPGLPLHLIYNPVDFSLPGSQEELENDYKTEFGTRFNIVFNRLYTITNMPIGRFASRLRHQEKYREYMDLLANAFNPAAVSGLMCRNTISVGWRGEVYDCDFNQQLDMQWENPHPVFLWEIDPEAIRDRRIRTGEHCFGCTAGAGSSCTGTLV